jgi:hypothetical protein
MVLHAVNDRGKDVRQDKGHGKRNQDALQKVDEKASDQQSDGKSPLRCFATVLLHTATSRLILVRKRREDSSNGHAVKV